MIIISTNLVLGSPSCSDFGPNNPVIGYRNVVAAGGIVADSEAAGFPAVNLANPSTSQRWRAAAVGLEHLTITTNEVGEIDYVGIATHNFGTEGIAVSLEWFDPGEEDWVELIAAFVPPDDGPLLLRLTPASIASIRVKLAEGNAAAEAAVVYCGKLTILERRIYVGHTPIVDGRVVNQAAGMSDDGSYLGTVILGAHVQTSVSMQNLTPSWYREHLRPFIKLRVPFFFAWRPNDYPREVGYAWFPTGHNPQPSNQRTNGMMQLDFQMVGVV